MVESCVTRPLRSLEKVLTWRLLSTHKDPHFAGQQRVPLVLGRKLRRRKTFPWGIWNEVKWEEELDWDPGDLTAVERGKGSGRQTLGLWGIRQGGLGAREASVGSQVPVEVDVHLPSGSLRDVWVC